MDTATLPALVDAIRHLYDCDATWVKSVPVCETFRGETVWEGEVQVFEVEHPQASLIYCWSEAAGEEGRRQFFAVLGAGPVTDALTAVQVSIAAELDG